ncbi:hypothetical protein N0V82_009470 [Gnomoniopsis sp. IMI 355080]|nr:hypothetical protein N0V82_009470 [Gnomoniopsis sp. IMI 355080]
MRWTLSQPDEIFSVGHAFAEIDGALYSLGTEAPIVDDWQGMLVKTQMGKVLENLCQAMNEELGVAFDACFGTDTENWRRIDLLTVVRRVVAQAASRFTVGLPLCRDLGYLDECLRMTDLLVANAGVAGGAPSVLKPVLGRLSGLPARFVIRKIKKYLAPLYAERVEMLNTHGWDEPQDHFQMMLRYAQKERPQELQDLDLLTKRVVAANFGSMHQTAIGVTNMLLNILGSDVEFNTISTLRSEVSEVLGHDRTQGWTKAKVAKLVKADSVSRETLRLNSFGGRALFRKVLVDGVVTDQGVALPKGTLFSFLSYPAHMDEASYEDATKYDPWRFSRIRGAADDSGESKGASLGFVTTGPDYMPFSHGRHACPGRFLVDFELKMIISYVLMNYDIKFPEEYGGKRPENRWVAEALFPPAGVEILVKRKTN